MSRLDDLFATARTGDPKAREALAGALYDILWPRFRCSFSITEAEDLVQSTMVLIFRRIERDRDRDPLHSFEQFVWVTAGRVERMARRAWAREQDRRDGDPPIMVAPDTSLSDRLDRHQRVTWIVTAADELDTADQRAVRGWAIEDDWRQQTETEGVARSTLRTRVHRALARLRGIVRKQVDAVRTNPEPSIT